MQLDEDLFIYLNSLHTSWMDPVMFYMSKTYFWLPVHILMFILIVKNYGKGSWIIIACVALSIAFANTLTSEIMKPIFLRLRPSHEIHLQQLIHSVNGYKGGKYGFASSHAANTFALASFLWLLFRTQYKHTGWLFLWAVVVTYTRIYLGVHYPGDVVVGGLIGLLSGWLGFILVQWILRKRAEKKSALAT